MSPKSKSTNSKSSKEHAVQEFSMEELKIGSAVYRTKLTNKFRNRGSWKRPDKRRIEALIPGTVQKIMVEQGDEVIQGTPLLILEAMKMRNEMRSPVSGVIKYIHVVQGEKVPKSHLLIELE